MFDNTPPDRDLIIDTMASWALEGLHPSKQTLEDIRELVNGTMTMEEFHRKTLEMVKHD